MDAFCATSLFFFFHLSLPWAFSQLGIFYGVIAVFIMSFWSSYNCWTVVRLKRYIERSQAYNAGVGEPVTDTASVHSSSKNADASSVASSRTNLTFPDVGEWAYGATFQQYVGACVCTQQMAICTVFISFIGENLLAVFDRINLTGFVDTHVGVMTLCLPFVLSLSFLPSMKRLTPVMVMGSLFLLACIGLIGLIMAKEWDIRPLPEELPQFKPTKMPLAACAILYSYEGICLILPIESSMKQPEHFRGVFWGCMTVIAAILAGFATLNVTAFGNVTNGSITAFLMDAYKDEPSITFWVSAANTCITFSVLLTYPIQLFPALELIGTSSFARWIGGLGGTVEDEEGDLSGFDPLPPLPEHDIADMESIPSEHHYGQDRETPDVDEVADDGASVRSAQSTLQSVMDAVFPKMLMAGDTPQLRLFLVFSTYIVAVAVPNVQALISLVGALAGSSTALLIPPVLELAWIRTLEEHRAAKHSPIIERSPRDNMKKREEEAAVAQDMEEKVGAHPYNSPYNARKLPKKSFRWCGGKHWAEKIKCYILFVLGVMFTCVGTYASLRDIIRIYAGHPEAAV